MSATEPTGTPAFLRGLSAEEVAARASSFGGAAQHYGRYRPGPPLAAVEWILPSPAGTVVDLGAGTGALSRLLIGRAAEVVAVEPDDRMRSVLTDGVAGVRAVAGRGESIPLPDGCADAVLASSSWHWMDTGPTLLEVGRVLVPGGVLGVLWSGPDPEGAFLVQARQLLAGRSREGSGQEPTPGADLADIIMGAVGGPAPVLAVPEGMPFNQPEHQVFFWDMALTADELIGLLGTFSWVITLPPETRQQVIDQARALLRDLLGVEGPVTVDVGFRAEAWKATRHS